MIVDAQAAAEKRRVEAEGEASAIFAKLEAEARGQFEILAKKGEGFRQMIAACGSADKAYQMLMLEHVEKLAETSAQAISNIKFDKVVVWEGGHGSNGNGTSGTTAFLHNLVRMMPPMMQVMKDIGGVEIPGIGGKISPEIETVVPIVPVETTSAVSAIEDRLSNNVGVKSAKPGK
jgi:flotillin